MNVIELREELGKMRKSVQDLSALALGGLDMTLDVDQQWNVSTEVYPAREETGGKGVIRYENLWTRITPDMTCKVARQVKDMRFSLEGRLRQASANIQNDILTTDHGGIIAFWRSNKTWLITQLHQYMWYSGSKIVFVDGFTQHGIAEAFLTRNNLAEMPLNFQADFICRFWPHFKAHDEKYIVYSDGPPPQVDKGCTEDGMYH